VKLKKFWEELIAYFPLRRHGPQRKRENYGTDTQADREAAGGSHKPPFIFSK
jgi:hypothetical protein